MDEAADAAEDAVHAARRLRDREALTYDERSVRREWELGALDTWLHGALDLRDEHVALDAGCGTGRLLPWLAGEAQRVIAVDYSAASLERARSRLEPAELARTDLHVADVRDMPVPGQAVDRALSIEVLGDFPAPEQRLEAARELRRVLRPGGIALAVVYHWPIAVRRRSGRWATGLPYHGWTVRELRRLFGAAGFIEVNTGGIATIPSLSKRLGVPAGALNRVAFTPLGRQLGFWVGVRARR
jgi:ubiquinone/menaquinone biosynthesis C-methylase UbiE